MIAMMLWGHFTKNNKQYKFFFPLIIIYILLLPFYVIAFVLYILFLIGSNNNSITSYLKIFLNIPVIFNSMKDLEIIVNNKEENFKIIVK